MSAKKKAFVEKGLVVAVFLVVAVVGVAIAQFSGTAKTDWARVESMGFSNEVLIASVDIANPEPFANIYAVQTKEYFQDAIDIIDFTNANMNPIANPGSTTPTENDGLAGNLGFVVVETNYEMWDVVVTTKWGGYLRRNPITTGSRPDTEADLDDEIYAEWIRNPNSTANWGGTPGCIGGTTTTTGFPPVTDSTCTTYDMIQSDAQPGVFLKNKNNVAVRLNVAVGTIGGFEDGDEMLTGVINRIYNGALYYNVADPKPESWADISAGLRGTATTKGSVSLATTLLSAVKTESGDPDDPYDPTPDWGGVIANSDAIVSATGQYILNADEAPVGYFDGTNHVGRQDAGVGMAYGASTADEYFTTIGDWHTNNSGSITGFTRVIEDPMSFYRAMVFYVNANLNVDKEDVMGRHNKNAEYSEEIRFEFWGPY